MLLTIDAGNTNSVFALYDQGADIDAPAIAKWRIRTNANRTCDEIAAWFMALCAHAGIDPTTIEDVIISSVVPAGNRWLDQFCRHFLNTTPVFIDHSNVGLQVALNKPQQAGADLLVNAYAVSQLYTTPAIIVDFGTATTFTALEGDHIYRGGVIAPGINLSLDALQRAAAQLPKIELCVPDHVVGRDTVSAMQSGLYWGYIGMIDGLVERIKGEMQGDPFVIATGGLAAWFEEASQSLQKTDPDLTLKGLRLVHQRLNA